MVTGGSLQMRKFLFVLFLFTSVSQFGCSPIKRGYLVCNTTDQPLLVEISFKKKVDTLSWYSTPQNSSEYGFEEPRLLKIESLEEEKYQRIELTEGQMIRDEALGKMRITVLKGQALGIHEDNGYERHRFERHEIDKPIFFPIAGLTLTGAKGRMAVEGVLAIQLFNETGKHNFRILY
jgi:hypothetical protein